MPLCFSLINLTWVCVTFDTLASICILKSNPEWSKPESIEHICTPRVWCDLKLPRSAMYAKPTMRGFYISNALQNAALWAEKVPILMFCVFNMVPEMLICVSYDTLWWYSRNVAWIFVYVLNLDQMQFEQNSLENASFIQHSTSAHSIKWEWNTSSSVNNRICNYAEI